MKGIPDTVGGQKTVVIIGFRLGFRLGSADTHSWVPCALKCGNDVSLGEVAAKMLDGDKPVFVVCHDCAMTAYEPGKDPEVGTRINATKLGTTKTCDWLRGQK